MGLIDQIKGKEIEIPNCSRDDLPKLFKEVGFKVGVEVGVFQGQYTEVLAKSGLKIYAVDPWMVYPGYGYQKEQVIQEANYKMTQERLAKYPNVTLLRKTSMEAVRNFEDESLDFVYIDGNHRFKYVAEDIYEWSFKVKKGGIICGHDYAKFRHRTPGQGCQVKEVVDAYVASYDITTLKILGRKEVIPGEKRDRYRSWMLIK